MPRSPKPMTLEQAISATGVYLEKVYGITDAIAGGVVLKDGTWIEFRNLTDKAGTLWVEHLLGRFSERAITDYSAPITRDVVILSLYNGNPYPVTRETTPGVFTIETPLPLVTLALVPQEDGVEARDVINPWP